jgi:hypothetical protein
LYSFLVVFSKFFFSWTPVHYLAPTIEQRKVLFIVLIFFLLVWSTLHIMRDRVIVHQILVHLPLLCLVVGYFCLRFIMENFSLPPDSRYVPGLVLSIIFFIMGLTVARNTPVVSTFLALYGTLLSIVGIVKLFSGELQLYSMQFQAIFPVSTFERDEVGYQAESFFLALAIVWSISGIIFRGPATGTVFLLVVACCAALLIAISGGRSAFVGMVAALVYVLGVRKRSMVVVFLVLVPTIAIGLLAWQWVSLSGLLLVERLRVLSDIETDPFYRIRLFASAMRFWLSDPMSFFCRFGPRRFSKEFGIVGAGMVSAQHYFRNTS